MTTDRPANPWQRFRRKVRDHGPLHTALLMLNHVVPRSLLDVKVWVVSSADLSTFIDAEDPDDDVRWQGSVDAGGLTIPDRKQPDFENLLECGKLAAVIERDGGIVAWDLFATERFIQKKWLWFAFGDRDIYSSWSFVAPDYRGQGLAVQLALFAYREFARRGYLRRLQRDRCAQSECAQNLRQGAPLADRADHLWTLPRLYRHQVRRSNSRRLLVGRQALGD